MKKFLTRTINFQRIKNLAIILGGFSAFGLLAIFGIITFTFSQDTSSFSDVIEVVGKGEKPLTITSVKMRVYVSNSGYTRDEESAARSATANKDRVVERLNSIIASSGYKTDNFKVGDMKVAQETDLLSVSYIIEFDLLDLAKEDELLLKLKALEGRNVFLMATVKNYAKPTKEEIEEVHKQAAQEAQTKAENIAKGLGEKLGQVVLVEEGNRVIYTDSYTDDNVKCSLDHSTICQVITVKYKIN